MALTKITNVFTATTVDSGGNGKRLAGFTESFYSQLGVESPALQTVWTRLCNLRAALMPGNVSIIGGRFQSIDPIGGTRSFDNAFPAPTTEANDLPGVSLQWTIRANGTPNQRSIIMRGIPDSRVSKGEYVPEGPYNNRLLAYFRHLIANFGFFAIDRTILPVKIISINDAGLVTTATPHGLVADDNAMIMSAVRANGRKVSDPVIVTSRVSALAFTIFVPRLGRDEAQPQVLNTQRGRVRKLAKAYRGFSITDEEIIAPTAIHRKAGAPLRKFVGRRTGSR